MPAIVFPHIGFAVAEGTILKWEKEVGAAVAEGEPLVEIASEKAISVVGAPAAGALLAIYAPPGAIVPEGETLGWVGPPGERPPEVKCRVLGWESEIGPPPPGWEAPAEASAAAPMLPPPERADGKIRSFMKGKLRETTGARMAKSWVDAPKVDLFAEIDFSRVVAHRQAQKEAGQAAVPFNMYIAHAVVKAFEEFPELNRNWIDGRAVPLAGIHVGVAVALQESLLTISLKNLGGFSLKEIERVFRTLIRKAAGMTLSREELYGSSLTVTNLGEFGIFGFTAVLNPPEIFILAIGELAERAVVREGKIVAAPISYFCLSFDHRGVDGAPASRLLQRIKHHLEHYSEET